MRRASRPGSPPQDEATGRSRRGPFLALIGLVCAGTLAALLGLNTVSAADEVQQQAIADQNALTAARVQQLQVELAGLRAPAALARAAGALGMVPAGNPAFLRVDHDGAVTVLGSAAPVSPPPIVLTAPPAGSSALVPTASPAPATGPAPATSSPTAPAPSATAPAPSATAPAPSATASAPAPGATPSPAATPSPVVTVTLPGGPR